MSEFIGSRISLISKSDIKYIGTLHEINSETSTVALENVSSYGTEGRKGNPAEEIPGSDQVYEYIVFRGSDVKELSIVEPPKENRPPQVPNDPAILGSARPPQAQQPPPQQPPNQHDQFRGPQPPYQQPPYGFQQGPPPNQFQPPPPPRFQGPGGPHGFPGQPGAVPGYNMGFGGPPPPPNYNMGYGPPPGHAFPPHPPPGTFSPPQQPQMGPPGQQGPPGPQRPPQQMHAPQQQPVGSKQSTPQPNLGQAPQPPQPGPPQKPAEMSTTPAPPSGKQTSAPPPPLESKPAPGAPASAPSAPTDAQTKAQTAKKAQNSRVAVPLPPSGPKASAKPPAAPVQAAAASSARTQTYADATSSATAAVAAAMAKLAPASRAAQPQQDGGAMDNLTQKVNQMRMQDGGAAQRGGRARGRGPGAPRGGRRDGPPPQKGVDVPKEDFDFESSNAKFNKQDLVKQAIASGSPLQSPAAEGADLGTALENGHHRDGAAEAGADEVVIPPKPTAGEKGYDKKASFFDNISSDLKDRSGGGAHDVVIDGRAMRTQERSKNMETFGQGSVDGGGFRGGMRGRGRGRAPGGGGRGRGGYDRGAGTFVGGSGNGGAAVRGRGRGGLTGEVGI